MKSKHGLQSHRQPIAMNYLISYVKNMMGRPWAWCDDDDEKFNKIRKQMTNKQSNFQERPVRHLQNRPISVKTLYFDQISIVNISKNAR